MKDFSYIMDGDKFVGSDFEANARAAYDAYCREVGGTTWDGKPIPTWEKISAWQRNGWRAATACSIWGYLEYEVGQIKLLQRMIAEHPGSIPHTDSAQKMPEPQSNVDFHKGGNDAG